MFIKLQKIKEGTKKDHRGNPVINPSDDKEIKEDNVVEEAIDVFSIKSMRIFTPDGKTHSSIQEQICVIYLKGHEKTPQLHVVAKYVDLVKEVNELKGRKPS